MTEISRQVFTMGCLQDGHLWKEVREQNSDKGLTASADLKESSGSRMMLQSCPKSGQWPCFYTPTMACGYPRKA